MNTKEKCERLHWLFNELERFQFNESDINKIDFQHGIYIIFEKNERAHNCDRIVRVGTTTGKNSKLAKRLKEHHDNKGRSVFRNAIALCLLQKIGDPLNLAELFCNMNKIERDQWEKMAIEKHQEEYLRKYSEINEYVSIYIQQNCSFVAFPVKEEERRFWEGKLISTISSCNDCKQSENWLGNLIPDVKRRSIIRKCGMWNINGVNDENIIKDMEIFKLLKILKPENVKLGNDSKLNGNIYGEKNENA
jgi:hypothetical protein